jgi:hypothetical protein
VSKEVILIIVIVGVFALVIISGLVYAVVKLVRIIKRVAQDLESKNDLLLMKFVNGSIHEREDEKDN